MAMICLRQHSYPYCLTRAPSVPWGQRRFHLAPARRGRGSPRRIAFRHAARYAQPSQNLRERRPYGCRMGQSAEDLMGFAQGRLLSRAAILDGCLSVFEVEVLGQTLGPGPISEGGSGAPGAHRSAAILDLDQTACWASHEFVVKSFGGEGSPDCVEKLSFI